MLKLLLFVHVGVGVVASFLLATPWTVLGPPPHLYSTRVSVVLVELCQGQHQIAPRRPITLTDEFVGGGELHSTTFCTPIIT
jgi:hypothetical protein